jgi:malate synthase
MKGIAMTMVEQHGLRIDQALYDFLLTEALPGTGVKPEHYFTSLADIIHDLAPKNRALLQKRDAIQMQIDDWYKKNGAPVDMARYEAFLRDIGYIVPEGGLSPSTQPMLMPRSLQSPARNSSCP